MSAIAARARGLPTIDHRSARNAITTFRSLNVLHLISFIYSILSLQTRCARKGLRHSVPRCVLSPEMSEGRRRDWDLHTERKFPARFGILRILQFCERQILTVSLIRFTFSFLGGGGANGLPLSLSDAVTVTRNRVAE